jgi:hypothetical protein
MAFKHIYAEGLGWGVTQAYPNVIIMCPNFSIDREKWVGWGVGVRGGMSLCHIAQTGL